MSGVMFCPNQTYASQVLIFAAKKGMRHMEGTGTSTFWPDSKVEIATPSVLNDTQLGRNYDT